MRAVIGACDLFLVLLSPGWPKSDVCREEYAAILRREAELGPPQRILVAHSSDTAEGLGGVGGALQVGGMEKVAQLVARQAVVAGVEGVELGAQTGAAVLVPREGPAVMRSMNHQTRSPASSINRRVRNSLNALRRFLPLAPISRSVVVGRLPGPRRSADLATVLRACADRPGENGGALSSPKVTSRRSKAARLQSVSWRPSVDASGKTYPRAHLVAGAIEAAGCLEEIPEEPILVRGFQRRLAVELLVC